MQQSSTEDMRRKLNNDPSLVDKIIPKHFDPGCRRPTSVPGYLEALVAANSSVFTDPIRSVTETGLTDHAGVIHEVDIIICATGFDTSWLPRFPFIANGVDLRDSWGTEKGVTSYLSVGVPNFPNTFSYCGPYGPFGQGSFIPLIEQWTRYMLSAISKVQVENINHSPQAGTVGGVQGARGPISAAHGFYFTVPQFIQTR